MLSLSEDVEIHTNPVFKPLITNESRYLVLMGGSGSGKSVFASQKMLIRAITEPKHRLLIIRKVGTTLRESVFKRFDSLISDLGLKTEFTVNKTEMKFTHETGNEIMCFGLDDPEKLKSIESITSVWIEEATELTENDFDQIDLRLRGETESYKQIILTFNPIDESHWLKKRFFDVEHPNTTTKRTTFLDNKFIDDEYRRVLESKASISPNIYRIYYLGEWGKEEIERPYAQNFNRERHVADVSFNPNLPVIFSLDFNVEPFVCTCAHIWTDGKGMHFHTFDEVVIEKNGSVDAMCDLLENQFGAIVMANCLFTGDAMQRKREITQRNNIDAWRMIDQRFRLGKRLMVPRANPSVKENRHLVNALLAFHPDVKFNPKCRKLIYDLQFVEADENGDIVKKNRNNESQRADALDCWRYTANTFLYDFLDRYRMKT